MINEIFQKIRDYEIFFSHSPIPIFEIDVSGKITDANPASCNLFGYTLDEFKDITFDKITEPKYLPADRELFSEVLSGKMDQYDMVKGYHTKSQIVFYKHLYVFADRDHDSGQIKRFIAVLINLNSKNTSKMWIYLAKDLSIITKALYIIVFTILSFLAKWLFDIDIPKLP